jgi:hypothetical protein
VPRRNLDFAWHDYRSARTCGSPPNPGNRVQHGRGDGNTDAASAHTVRLARARMTRRGIVCRDPNRPIERMQMSRRYVGFEAFQRVMIEAYERRPDPHPRIALYGLSVCRAGSALGRACSSSLVMAMWQPLCKNAGRSRGQGIAFVVAGRAPRRTWPLRTMLRRARTSRTSDRCARVSLPQSRFRLDPNRGCLGPVVSITRRKALRLRPTRSRRPVDSPRPGVVK